MSHQIEFEPDGISFGKIFKIEVIKKTKYNVYNISTRKSFKHFGLIKWYFPWQQYCFYPDKEILLLTDEMLYEIYRFINLLEFDLKNKINAKISKRKEIERKKLIKTPEELKNYIEENKDEMLKEGERLYNLESYYYKYPKHENLFLILALRLQFRLETGNHMQFIKGKIITSFKGWLIGKRLTYLSDWMEEIEKSRIKNKKLYS